MTPEEKQLLENLKRKVTSLEEENKKLQSSSTIPFSVDNALRDRFIKGIPNLSVSSKGADTEDQAVDESGSGSYSVMGDPDIFLEVSINGTTYYLPAFT